MTATDLDLDALLDALTARAIERAEGRPLINEAGLEVSAFAAGGRLVVHPGDTILSSWGNATYDQTVQTYSSTADRDAQWPTPKDGAVAYTLDTATVWLRRAGVWVSLATGLAVRVGVRYALGATTSPATVNQIQQLNLGAKVYDQANAVTGNVYTCPVAGRYLARVSTSAPIPTGITVSAFVRRNGTSDTQNIMVNNAAGAVILIPTAVNVIMCAAGDTLDTAWQIGSASIVLRTGASESSFAVDYLGPT